MHETGTPLDASYPARPPQVAEIRRAVSAVATRCGATPATLLRIELAVSEAATNVVQHAYRTPASGGHIHVTARRLEGDLLEVCVADDGVGIGPRTDSPGLGLGIGMMAHESDELKIGAGASGGTEVLLRFELRAGERAAAAAHTPRSTSSQATS